MIFQFTYLELSFGQWFASYTSKERDVDTIEDTGEIVDKLLLFVFWNVIVSPSREGYLGPKKIHNTQAQVRTLQPIRSTQYRNTGYAMGKPSRKTRFFVDQQRWGG